MMRKGTNSSLRTTCRPGAFLLVSKLTNRFTMAACARCLHVNARLIRDRMEHEWKMQTTISGGSEVIRRGARRWSSWRMDIDVVVRMDCGIISAAIRGMKRFILNGCQAENVDRSEGAWCRLSVNFSARTKGVHTRRVRENDGRSCK